MSASLLALTDVELDAHIDTCVRAQEKIRKLAALISSGQQEMIKELLPTIKALSSGIEACANDTGAKALVDVLVSIMDGPDKLYAALGQLERELLRALAQRADAPLQ